MDIVLLNKNEMGYEYPAEDRSNKNWRPRILCKLWIYKKQRPEKFQKNVLNYFSYMQSQVNLYKIVKNFVPNKGRKKEGM